MITTFLIALSYKEKPCYWQIHMSYKYEDFEFTLEDIEFMKEKRMHFYEALKNLISELKPFQDYRGAFEVPGTEGQSKSDLWRKLRSLNCTGSCAKKICHMKAPKAIMKFLRMHLWGLDAFESRACKYGQDNESKAREAYYQLRIQHDSTVKVQTTGLHMHTDFLGLACSLDGRVLSDKSPTRNLEIKCPHTLRN